MRMITHLYIASESGVFVAAHADGNWRAVGHALPEKHMTAITVTDRIILAGSTEGVWRSSDNGRTWSEANEGLGSRHVRWMSHASHAQAVFLVGTEPAGIYISRDGGQTWNSRPEVGRLRDASGWFLPYSEAAGCVRDFAVATPAKNHGRLYAAVEVGGVLVSDDGGDTWRLAEGSDGRPDMNRDLGSRIHPDLHSITVHPASENLVTAATGGGLYRSNDGGGTWKCLYHCYVRAVWVDPADDRHLIAGPAEGVSRKGRIEESTDAGQNWHLASGGMTAIPWPTHMVERFFHFEDTLFAVLSNGELWSRPLKEARWHQVLAEIPRITAVAGDRG
jgi:photosystem II stability/assembly factor-like uncharacterized protein